MTSRKANRTVIRGQLRGAAISVMDALNEELNAGMPAGQLRDAAESLRALAEVLGQMESAEKLAETAEALKKQAAGLGKASKSGTDKSTAAEDEVRVGVIEIAKVLEEAETDG